MSHQLAHGRLRLGRAQYRLTALEAIEHLEFAELGHDRRHRRVEVEAPLLDELQCRGGRDGLGHRRVAKHRVGPRVAGCALVEDAVAADHRGGDAMQRAIGGHAVQQVWIRRHASGAMSSRGIGPCDRLDFASDAGGARQACIGRHQNDVESFSECDVGGVVGSHTVTQLPNAFEQRPMGRSL